MLDKILQTIIDFALSAGVRLVGALLLLIIGLKLIKSLIKILEKGKGFSKIDVGAKSFIRSFISIALKTVLIITVASILGVPMTSMVAVLGSAGLAIGLALQGSLANLAGGVIILIFKPFRVNDFITVNGLSGTVISIDIFYTKLKTPDNRGIVIPNGSITNNSITDSSSYSTRRVDFTFSTSYESDIDKVKEILNTTAENHPLILKDPVPLARLNEHGVNALIFILQVWCKSDDYGAVNFDVLETVKQEFSKNGIDIPFPQLDVHINK